MNRNQVTEKIIAAKRDKNLEWRDIALQIDANKGTTVAGCLGQGSFSQKQAEMLAQIFNLTEEEAHFLTLPPEPVPPDILKDDPLMKSLHEIINRYGEAIKEMVNETLGDGVLTIYDLNIDTKAGQDGQSHRVQITLDTKFLPARPEETK